MYYEYWRMKAAPFDDVPDPVQPDATILYGLTYYNMSSNDLTGVVVTAVYDPRLTFVWSYPPPDTGTVSTWTVGTVPARSAGRIYMRLDSPTGVLTQGEVAQVWMLVGDSNGAMGAAVESTVFSDTKPAYSLEVAGAPKNPTLGVNPGVTYSIRATNETPDTATNVTVSSVLPQGLSFVNASPPPATVVSNRVSWIFPRINAFTSKLILLQTGLDPLTTPGATLENVVSVSDDNDNLTEASFVGRVRGVAAPKRPLGLSMTAVTKASVGSQMRYNLGVQNNKVTDMNDVTLTVTIPSGLTVTGARPALSSNTGSTVSWQLGRRPAWRKVAVQLSVRLPDDAVIGTRLNAFATASNSGGESAAASAVTTVKR